MEDQIPSLDGIKKLQLNSENVENGLVQLVLSLINTIKELMEKQALQKIEEGKLTDEQIEKLGYTLLTLETKIKELQQIFGLSDDDLEIDISKYINIQ